MLNKKNVRKKENLQAITILKNPFLSSLIKVLPSKLNLKLKIVCEIFVNI